MIAMVAQVASLLLGACQNGQVASCTISGCVQAEKVCVGGAWDPCECKVWSTLNCDDANPCTLDTNVGNSYCQYSITAGAPCEDGDNCTGSGTCSSAGSCEPGKSSAISDGSTGTYDFCALGLVQHDTGNGSGASLDSSPPSEAYSFPGTAPNPLTQAVPSMPTTGGPTVNESTGDLEYAYTFTLPSARGRFQPSLEIRYSSASTSDEGIGLGWAITSSYIEIDVKTPPTRDGSAIRYRRRLVLSGSGRRLIQGASGTWVPESGGGIVSLTDHGTYWDGRDMEGNLYTFAARYAVLSGQRFYLTAVVDVDGNRTTYSYSQESGLLAYLSSITYNEAPDLTPGTKVELSYGVVAPPRGQVMAAGLATIARNLTAVSLGYVERNIIAGNIVDTFHSEKHYELTYSATNNNVRSLLTSIKLVGDAGTIPVPFQPTQFTYETASAGYTLGANAKPFTAEPAVWKALGTATSGSTAAWVDLDGDGRVDRVFQSSDGGHLVWARNTSTPGSISFSAPADIWSSQGFTLSTTSTVSDPDVGTTRVYTSGLLDMNGDGFVDLVWVGPGVVNVKFGHAGVYFDSATSCFAFDGGFTGTPLATEGAISGAPVLSKDDVAGIDDVNRDGIADYYVKAHNSTAVTVYLGKPQVRGSCAWSFSNGFPRDSVVAEPRPVPAEDSSRYLADGSPIGASSWGYTSKKPPVGTTSPANVGLCPVDYRGAIDFFEMSWDPRQTQALADLNGDGKLDLIERETDSLGNCLSGGCRWAVWWGTGLGFVRTGLEIDPRQATSCQTDFSFPEAHTMPGLESWACASDDPDYPETKTVRTDGVYTARESGFVDIDGDGVVDWAINWPTSGTCAPSSNQWTAYLGSSEPPLLRSVKIPAGAVYSVAYRRIEEFGSFSPDNVKASRNLVFGVSVSGARMDSASTYYWYETPTSGPAPDDTYDGYLEEPRGFTRTTVYDQAAGIGRVTTWATTNHALQGMPVQVDVGELNVGNLSPGIRPVVVPFRQVLSTNAVCAPTGANGRVFPIVSQMTSRAVVSGTLVDAGAVIFQASQSTSCSDVDALGNVTRMTRDPDLGTSGDEVVEYSSFDSNATCKICPVETSTYSGPGAATPMSRRVFRYDSAAGTWNAPLPVNSAGTGHLNYVVDTVWYQGTSWTERASATAYNSDGTVAFKVTDPDAGSHAASYTESYTYDAKHMRVVQVSKSDASVTLILDYTYDVWGRKTLEVGPYVSGSAWPKAQRAFAYDAAGRNIAVGRIIGSSGAVTGPIAATTYLDATATAFAQVRSYTFMGPRTDFVVGAQPLTPDVKVTVSHLDDLGRIVEVRERLGGTGSAVTGAQIIQNLSGTRVVSTKYDALGLAIGSTEPVITSTSEATFEGLGAIVGQDPTRRSSLKWFDRRGRLGCSLSGTWTAVDTIWNQLKLNPGNPSACTSNLNSGSGHVIAVGYSYEALSNPPLAIGKVTPPRSQAMPGSAGDRTAYRPDGRVAWNSDAYGNKTTFAYSIPDRSVATTRQALGAAMSGQTATRYLDSKGRTVSETDDNWSPHFTPSRLFTYDALDRPVSAWVPGQLFGSTRVAAQMRYEYKSLGRKTLVTVQEPMAVGGGVAYGASRTIEQLSYDRPYGNDGSYTYVAGQVASITSPLTTMAFGYDQNGRPSRKAQWFTGLTGAFVTTSSLAEDGRMLSASFSSGYGKTLTWSGRYDSSGRAVQIDSNGATVKFWEAVSQGSSGAYDALGRLVQVKSNNGTVSTLRSFDAYTAAPVSLVVQNQSGSVKHYSMESAVFKGSKLISYSDNSTSTSYAFGYDGNSRLKTATTGGTGGNALSQTYNEAYSHSDPSWMVGATLGNLEQVTLNGVLQEYDYSSDRVIQRRASSGSIQPYAVGTPSYVYDHAGRMTAGWGNNTEVEGYAFDVLDHLTAIRSNGTVTQVLEYGPEGELLYRKEGTKAYFYVNGQATITADVPTGCTGYGGANCTVSNVKVGVHVSMGGERVATVRVAAGSGNDTAGDVLYYHRDIRGSIVATTLTGGGVGVKYRYSPYGSVDRKQVTNSAGESELGYTGGLKLTTSAADLVVDGKLILLGARVYHADLRRWLQADTVDPLRYTYANGDPVNLTDPSGRRPKGGLFKIGAYNPDAWFLAIYLGNPLPEGPMFSLTPGAAAKEAAQGSTDASKPTTNADQGQVAEEGAEAKNVEGESVQTAGTGSPAGAQQFEPLTGVEKNGRKTGTGDVMLEPRTPGPGEVSIDVCSRPIDTSGMNDVPPAQRAVVGYLEHSALIIRTTEGVTVVQSGPTGPNGTGQNLASVSTGTNGLREAQTFITTHSTYIVPSSVAAKVPGLVDTWNNAKVQYSTTNLPNPGPNSNTFTRWMSDGLGLRTFSSGVSLAHPLPGWGFQGPLPPR